MHPFFLCASAILALAAASAFRISAFEAASACLILASASNLPLSTAPLKIYTINKIINCVKEMDENNIAKLSILIPFFFNIHIFCGSNFHFFHIHLHTCSSESGVIFHFSNFLLSFGFHLFEFLSILVFPIFNL